LGRTALLAPAAGWLDSCSEELPGKDLPQRKTESPILKQRSALSISLSGLLRRTSYLLWRAFSKVMGKNRIDIYLKILRIYSNLNAIKYFICYTRV
jgi:hypothetical protein